MSERMKVIYITTTGDNTLELPTPLDVEGYLCGLVESAGKVVNLKGDLFLAELFRGMLFKWKGENKKSHQK